MAISYTAAPFFEPGAPPAILPMPTAHTDMRYYHPHRQSPLINEELPPLISSTRSRRQSISASPEPQVPRLFASGSKQLVKPRRRSISATPETPRTVRFDTPLSYSSSDSESSSPFDDQADNKIPKPAGDAGRPGSGGYNLEHSLAWRKDEFKRLKNYISQEADNNLDTTQCYKGQDPESLQDIREEAITKFPALENYTFDSDHNFQSCWPVDDLLKAYLKNTASKWRREQKRKVVKKALDRIEKSRKGKGKGKM